MKIGLVRHFKVDARDLTGEVTASEFSKWMKEYDHIEVIPKEVDLRGIDWNKCYSSDLYRAQVTAKTIFDGEIKESSLIREIRMNFTEEFEKSTSRKVSFYEWSVYSMLDWAKSGNKVEENITACRERVNKFLDNLFNEVSKEDRILLVCHGMIMTVLEEQLKLRGFAGETVVAAKNGEVFLYEK